MTNFCKKGTIFSMYSIYFVKMRFAKKHRMKQGDVFVQVFDWSAFFHNSDIYRMKSLPNNISHSVMSIQELRWLKKNNR